MKLPPPDSYSQYKERVLCLQALHDASCTSSGRTTIRNAQVGGAEMSKHLLARGAWADDLVPDEMNQFSRAAIVRDAQTFGLWALDEGDHVHVQGKAPTGGIP